MLLDFLVAVIWASINIPCFSIIFAHYIWVLHCERRKHTKNCISKFSKQGRQSVKSCELYFPSYSSWLIVNQAQARNPPDVAALCEEDIRKGVMGSYNQRGRIWYFCRMEHAQLENCIKHYLDPSIVLTHIRNLEKLRSTVRPVSKPLDWNTALLKRTVKVGNKMKKTFECGECGPSVTYKVRTQGARHVLVKHYPNHPDTIKFREKERADQRRRHVLKGGKGPSQSSSQTSSPEISISQQALITAPLLGTDTNYQFTRPHG